MLSRITVLGGGLHIATQFFREYPPPRRGVEPIVVICEDAEFGIKIRLHQTWLTHAYSINFSHWMSRVRVVRMKGMGRERWTIETFVSLITSLGYGSSRPRSQLDRFIWRYVGGLTCQWISRLFPSKSPKLYWWMYVFPGGRRLSRTLFKGMQLLAS